MKLSKRMLFGIISIVLAAVIAFIGIPAVSRQNSTTVHIVRVKSPITEGSVISAEALEILKNGYSVIENHGKKISSIKDLPDKGYAAVRFDFNGNSHSKPKRIEKNLSLIDIHKLTTTIIKLL